MKKNSSWRKIFVFVLALVTVLSVTMPALAADSFGWSGKHKDGDSASSISTGGYSIMYGTAGKCVLGYRFAVVNKDGKPISTKATQDVYFKESNIASRYRGLQVSNSRPMSRPQYFYEDYMEDEDPDWVKSEVKTSTSDEYAKAESACGFNTSLPRGDVDYAYEMATWGANARNAAALCTLLGTTYSVVQNNKYTITVEPIFGFTVNNLPVAWTVADIGAWGKVYFSGGTTPASKGDSGATYGFIANYTNMHFANLLYVDDLNYLGNWSSKATALTSRTSFNNLYYKAYGTGILIASGKPIPIPETKGYTLTLIGDEGVESFTSASGTFEGNGKYTGFVSGDKPVCTVVLKPGYRLVNITGTGYNGSGTWNETDNGRLPTESTYTTNFTMKADRTLTAVTEKINNKCTLTVIGDQGILSTTGSGEYAYGAVPTVTVTAKPGYTLSHYYGTTRDGSDYATWQIAAGKTYDSDTWGLYADRTIYVYSKPIDYTLTYDPNGGSVTPGSTTFTYSGALTNLAVPTRAGYTFNRWYAEFSGSNYINLGRDYMYTDKLSVHLEAYMSNWSTYVSKDMRLISCTEGGGWNIEKNGDYIQFGIYDSGTGYKSVKTSKTWASLSAGWHTFDLVFDGSYAYCYVDGSLVGTSVKFSSGKIGYHASNSIILGAEAGGSSGAVDGNYFTGYIANLSITHSSTRVTSTASQFMAPAQNFTLKAEWTPIKYTVVYKPNGATGSDWSNTVTTGSNYTVEENWYSYTGYRFTGWSTKSSGDDGYGWTGWSGTWNYVNGQYGISNNTLTLYAQWTPNSYGYTVNHYLQNVSGSGYTLDSSVTGTATFGSKFTGTVKSYTGFKSPSAQTITIGTSGNVINYYYDRETYYLDLNGCLDGASSNNIAGYGTADIYINGSLVANDVTDYYTAWPYGTTYEIKDIKQSTGHTYNGVHSGSISGTITSGKNVYLNFTTNRVQIAYNPNGGTVSASGYGYNDYGWVTQNGVTYFHALSYGSSDDPYNASSFGLTRPGYTFGGWRVHSTGQVLDQDTIYDSTVYADHTSSSKTTANTSVVYCYVYAVWNPITYTDRIGHWALGFNGEGNNGDKTAFSLGVTTFNKQYGATVNYTSADATRIPNGFYLMGHLISPSYSSDGSWLTYTMPKSFTQPASSTYVEYYYNPYTYNITYNLNGGTNNSANPSSYNVLYGVNFSNPTRTGYTFAGWYINGVQVSGINPGANASFSSADDMYSKLASRTTGDVTVEAQWIPINYTITYDPNGGTLSGSATQNYNITTNVTLQATPTRNGYSFTGWKLAETIGNWAAGTYDAGKNIGTGKYGNITLVAQWKMNSHTLTIIGDEGVASISGAGQYTHGDIANTKVTAKPGYLLNYYYGTNSTGTGTSTWTTCNGLTTHDDTWTMNADRTIYVYTTPINYQVIYTDGFNLMRGLEDVGDTTSFWMTYSISNGTVTVTGNASDGCGFTTGRVYLEAGKTYYFSCKTNGTWTGQTEAFLMLDGNLNVYYHMASKDGYAFTPSTTGTYWLRLDVNASGATYKFWDISVVEGTTSPNVTGYTATSTHTYGVAKNLTANGFSRVGYTFNKWNTKADGTGTSYANGESVVNLTTTNGGTVILYAQWTPIQYTVHYNGNGATGGSTADSTHIYDVAKKLTQNGFIKTGYQFAGWNTKADGTGTSYTDAQEVKNLTTVNGTVINLYAQWKPIQYTIHYNGNGATGGSTADSTHIYDVAKKLTQNGFTKTGYQFAGWNTKADGTGTSYTDAQEVKNLTTVNGTVINLYAKWTPVNYTITYNPNGGTLAGSATQNYNITTNVTLQAAPTRTGYTFAGWKLSTDTGNWTAGTYAASKNVGTGKYGNITLVAQWTPINYTITYDPNGGTLVGNSTQTYDPTTSVTLQGAPTRPGYTFAGWKLAETTGNWYAGTYSAGKTVGKGKYGNITLVAQWASDTIKITLDKNGGTGGLDCFYFKYGINKYYSDANCTQEITSIALPSKTGYTFNRYYGDGTSGGSNGETYIYNTGSIATDLCTDIYKDATLYAEWTLNQYSYTVNYYLQNIGGDGYTLDANSTIHGTADFGSKVTGTVKSFTGFNPPSAQSIIISADEKENVINYYYTRNKYTVTVNAGTGISSTTGAGEYWYGEQVSINAEPSTGYAWSKWTGYVSTTDKKYSFTMPAKNVSVTANATPIDYTITYDPNGGSLVGEKTQGYIITTDITLQAAPTRTGYTFAGWKLSTDTGNWTAGTYEAGKNVGTGKYGNITLVAQWTVNSYKYTVNHYLMNLDGKTYTLDSSVTGTATFGSKVTGALKSYTGFTAPSAQTITISANEKENVINYYYTRNKYTVTLINGTGISSVSGAGSYYYGESVTINANVLTGYAWSKWTGTHSTSTQKYTFTMPAANVTDTANATAIGYTITYDPNGGTLAGSANQSYNITTNVTLQAAPTRNGYTFAGWKLATATGNWTAGTYDAGKNVGTGMYGNITLVAQWTPNGYTITYDPNGGTLVGNSTQTYDPTISVTLQNAPSRRGYTFAGWKLATATGNWTAGTYEAGKNVGTGKYGNITLVAQWTPIQYTVVYKPNGASGSDWSNTVTTGSKYTVKDNWYSRPGYIFTGWSTNPNGDDGYGWTGWSGTWNYVNGQYGISNNTLTLYAQWRPIKYTIHYDGNGATAGSTSDSSHTYDVEQGLTPNGFTKPGYVPDGWNTKSDGSGTSYKDKESVKNLTDKDGDTITLYIQWKPITYNIQYVLNGGTHGASHPNSATYDQSFTVSNPTRGQGYVFRGWTITGMDGTTHYIGSSTTNSTSVSAIMDTVFKNLRSTEGTVTFTANWYSYDVELVDISFKYIDGSGNTQTVTDMNNMVYGTKYYVFYTYRNNSNTTVTADCYGSGKKLLATKTLAAGKSVTLQGGSFTPGIGDGILSGYIYLNGCTFGDTSGEYNGSNNSKTVSFKTKFDIELKEIYLADANGSRLDPTQIFTNQKVYIHHVYKNNSGGSVTVNGYHQNSAITVSGSYAFTLEANATKDVIVKIHTPTQAETTTITGAVWRNGKNATTEYFETNLSNNTKSLAITVLEMPYLEPIRPNQGYRQGTDVITSYYVHNDSSVVYNPSNGITVTMNVYNKDTGALVTTKTQTVYVPANETQLIWFKWSVPEDATSDFRIKATIVANGVEGVLVDKTYSLATYDQNNTPDTEFEGDKPSWWTYTKPDSDYGVGSNWSVWEWENGVFVKKNYGIFFNSGTATISPFRSPTAVLKDGVWCIRSGYGFTLSVGSATVEALYGGYLLPDSSAYTMPQYVYARYPEFQYKLTANNGVCGETTMEKVGQSWYLPDYLDYNGRCHFTPIWYPDGNYIVTVLGDDIWTPMGCYHVQTSAKLKISGSVYDDWYIS